MAYRAAQLYSLSQTMIYSVSTYSEPTFTFFELLSLYLLYCFRGGSFSTLRLVLSSFPLIFATFTRSTGMFTAIVPLFYLLQKFVDALFRSNESMVNRLIHALLQVAAVLVIVMLVAVIPVVLVTTANPYKLYCESRMISN